ncbi:MAG: hypothetical protein QM695_03695 [Micropruina sp.]
MSDTDSEGPRRVADDADGGLERETPDAGAGVGSDRPAQGQSKRSWAKADGSGRPEPHAAPEVTTPIPPPTPALPEPAQPPAGRRFSAEDLPEGWQGAAPRRSAVSVSSPPFSPSEVLPPRSDGEGDGPSSKEPGDGEPAEAGAAEAQAGAPAAGAGTEPAQVGAAETGAETGPETAGADTAESLSDDTTAEAAGTQADRPEASDDTASDDDPPGDPGAGAAAGAPDARRRMLTWVLGGVAAVVLVGLIIWLALPRPGGTAAPGPSEPVTPATSASPSPAPALVDAQLITAGELAKLRKGVRWTPQGQSASPGVPKQPACVELSATGGGSPDSELNHAFTASKGGAGVVQVVQAWPDDNAATTAFTALVTQAGACEDSLVRSAERVTGFADAATSLTVQTADGGTHTLVFARTGRFVSIVDGGTPAGAKNLPTDALVAASTASMGRQCGPASGACPATPKVVGTTPPATETVGWLAWVDLPQVTAGTGKWSATDPQAPKLVGSQCENVDLNDLRGASDALHRTYVLTNDPKAPQGFGIDEAIYSFSKASGAGAMAKQLAKNFDGCGERTRTASVKSAGVKAPAANGKDLNATSYLVTQRISDSKTASFRVGIAAIGNRLVYLLANPSSSFDFSDDAWKAIVGRATQRATQFP